MDHETFDLGLAIEDAERLNRQHLDALNAQIIKLSNDKALLLAALKELLDYSADMEIWINGCRSNKELHRRRVNAYAAIKQATPKPTKG